MNSTEKLWAAGQSVWYDNIQRSLLRNGEMAGMIARGEIRGVTSNPSIFMNAIANSSDYDESLKPLSDPALSAEEVFFRLAIEDIQAAADLFLPLYQGSGGADGYVSLEVSPFLADKSAETLAQAEALWQRVKRPNLMIKIPATKAGLPAIQAAIAKGINVNVTLIFSRERYSAVMEAYLSGLEARAEAGLPLERIASVASFFISRVDSHIDPRLQAIGTTDALALAGQAAVANARLAYAQFLQVFGSERFARLKAKGARKQRPLWASTSTKNPAYRDVMYVEELVGADTVNTMPPQTLAAFLDHGRVRESIVENLDAARALFESLEELGIKMPQVTAQLEAEGVKAFADAFSVLLGVVDKRRKA